MKTDRRSVRCLRPGASARLSLLLFLTAFSVAFKSAHAQSAPSEVTAIVGADVYTVTREVVRGGTVLVRDGKILRVGQDIAVPEGAKVIEAKGKVVTPGFVAIRASQVGIGGGAGGTGRFADSLDPYDRDIEFCLGSGITTACVTAGFAPPFPIPDQPGRGSTAPPTRHAVIKMTYGDLDGMLLRENPIYMLSSGSLSGQLNRFNWRDNLTKARRYIADQAQYEKEKAASKTAKQPTRPVPEELTKLVRGELTLRTDAGTTDQIRDMIALSREFGYRLLLEGAHESWLVAEELGQNHVSIIVTPRRHIAAAEGREDSTGSSIETAAVLEKAGVPLAVSTLSSSVSLDGIAGRDLMSLPLEAAFAVRGGCSERTALASITIVPAQLLGVADRIGSIEPGKDADLLILDGHPLDYRTYVETAIVNGKVYYERSKNRIFPVFERGR